MARITIAYNPPANYQDFESLCRQVFALHWNCTDMQKFALSGQSQEGVDLLGTDIEGNICGIQCKLHSQKVFFTETEVRKEIEKAKLFKPSLTRFAIATTAKRDKELQKLSAAINSEQLLGGSFTVAIYTWDDLNELLNQFPTAASLLEVQTEHAAQQQVDVSRIPSTSDHLFGRAGDLEVLANAWDDLSTRVIEIVAWGGVGKTALVNDWIGRISTKAYLGATHVLGWSFSDRPEDSADAFFTRALEFFNYEGEIPSASWAKGTLVAQLSRLDFTNQSSRRTLLVLDSLEALTFGSGISLEQASPGLVSLLRNLAAHGTGLCIIASRTPTTSLRQWVTHTVQQLHLENLNKTAGAQLLAHLGAHGTQNTLETASEEVDGHALSLQLLGGFVRLAYSGDITKRSDLNLVAKDKVVDGNAHKIAASYLRLFSSGSLELKILRALSTIGAGTNEYVNNLASCVFKGDSEPERYDDITWNAAVTRLKDLSLVGERIVQGHKVIEMHPIMYEFISAEFEASLPNEFFYAHILTMVYCDKHAPKYPSTAKEAMILLSAVQHLGKAKRYNEGLFDFLYSRLEREEGYNLHVLHTYGPTLQSITDYFEIPYYKPKQEVDPKLRAFLLGEATNCLRCLGRLDDAIRAGETALSTSLELHAFGQASAAACTLVMLFLEVGKIQTSIEMSFKAIEYAGKGSDKLLLRDAYADSGHALHLAGRLTESQDAFKKAETIHNEYGFVHEDGVKYRTYPAMKQLAHAFYCDLLVTSARYQDAVLRLKQFLQLNEKGDLPSLERALHEATLARMHLLSPGLGRECYSGCTGDHLAYAADQLRQFDSPQHLPYVLLLTAEYKTYQGSLKDSVKLIEEAEDISRRCGMQVASIDCLIERIRLLVALSLSESAKREIHLIAAKENVARLRTLIESSGYYRRSREVLELAAQVYGKMSFEGFTR